MIRDYASRGQSVRSAASGSLARMRINAIVAGSIATRFCSQFRNFATSPNTSSSGFSPSSIIWGECRLAKRDTRFVEETVRDIRQFSQRGTRLGFSPEIH